MKRKKTIIIAISILLAAVILLGVGASKALSSKGSDGTKSAEKETTEESVNETKHSDTNIDSSDEWKLSLFNKIEGDRNIAFAGKIPEEKRHLKVYCKKISLFILLQ